ncbi:MAG: hypothetical protein VYE22_37870 [Myxococcota bacterium]|nr:hypothetical protein [Myxococcota bacterium]
MRLCATAPIPHTRELSRGAMAMALAHLARDDEYAGAFRELSESGTHVVLNNGAYEAHLAGRELLGFVETLELAARVGATEVQLPEVDGDGEATLALAREWLARPGAEGVRWHAVSEGATPGDFLTCFDGLASHPSVAVIGIAKGIVPRAFCAELGVRDPALARLVVLERLTRRTDKPLHLLGLTHPREVFLARRLGPQVRSVDSTIAVNHAIEGVVYDDAQDLEPPVTRFDPALPLASDVLARASHNLRTLRRWCADS